MKRHATVAPDATTLEGRYFFELSWAADGTLDTVTDSLGRALLFEYRQVPAASTEPWQRTLAAIFYRAKAGATPVGVVELEGNLLLERVSQTGTANYTRFRYISPGTGPLIGQIIVPGEGANTTVGNQSPPGPHEIVLEENSYAPFTLGTGFSSGFVGVGSKYPGRHYEYQYSETGPEHTVQLDLHQGNGETCSSNSDCVSGTRCASDNHCYVADVMTHEAGSLLPISRASADGILGSGMGNSNAFNRSYGAAGLPLVSKDASGVPTSYGYDSIGRVRCIVRNFEGQAFVDPSQPETSACAGSSATAQIIRVDYNGPCSDNYPRCTIKRTPSVFGGDVIEEEDFDSNGLSVRTKTTGMTRTVDGTDVTQVQIHLRDYDALGRLIASDGPLDNSVALDRTTTSYYPSTAAAFDIGHVYQTTRFAGTSAASLRLVTTYSEYDVYGVPHRVTGPNGDYVTYSPSSDRLVWEITQFGTDDVAMGTTTVTLNPDGSVRSSVDADGVCMTFEYVDRDLPGPHNYVGAPTTIRRGHVADGRCGVLPVDRSTGEVEIRRYVHGERERLESITRQKNGVVDFTYSGFEYDRDRRLISASTLNSSEPYRYSFTDVLQTGVRAPGGPGPGAWQTDTTVDAFARPSSLARAIDGGNAQTFQFGYSSSFSPRPTTLTRGMNGSSSSTSTFVYDDFGRLVESTVPEAGAPTAPAPTRFEYDIASRLTKKRIGVGTPLVQTSVTTYDSLGRVLTVDHDVEHPVVCRRFAPVQDEEYHYDQCSAPDRPAGFTCGNALGRLTIARALVECFPGPFGTSDTLATIARWYDYDSVGRVARVAYAGVTTGGGDPAPRVGVPAIMAYTYSSAGRLTSYGSPLNLAFPTRYSLDPASGQIESVSTSSFLPSSANIARSLRYRAFGPLTGFLAQSFQPAAGGVRQLTLTNRYRSDNSLASQTWSQEDRAGSLAPIALLSQSLSYSQAGLLVRRRDSADHVASREYAYDSLLRLTCEARGTATDDPTRDDCNVPKDRVPWFRMPEESRKNPRAGALRPGPHTAALFTYGNGESPTSPQDVRLTSWIATEDGSYISPSVEVSRYTNGSAQTQVIERTGGNLVLGYDALGRRVFDYDSRDPVRSRRDYEYLPNGQLGQISVRTPDNEPTGFAIRYDETGRPILIRHDRAPSVRDTYELFWDDADRLVAADIRFSPARVTTDGTLTSARWHYHYAGSMLVAATRELVGTGAEAGVKRFWVVSDERGLVHRMLDEQGATYWQARWDASGWRTLVGQPQPEMWVPFGLPGQVVLGTSVVFGADGQLEGATGTEVVGGGTVRPPIALNRWRAYDPLMGFFQADALDTLGRAAPEMYAYGRHRPVSLFDRTGLESTGLGRLTFGSSCGFRDVVALTAAANHAYAKLAACTRGYCTTTYGRREWLAELSGGKIGCPKVRTLDGYEIDDEGFATDPERSPAATTPGGEWSDFYPVVVGDALNPSTIECAAAQFAHERLHAEVHNVLFVPGIRPSSLGNLPTVLSWALLDNEEEEALIDHATEKCFNCTDAGGKAGYGAHEPNPIKWFGE